jgi:outer membrane protein TolC
MRLPALLSVALVAVSSLRAEAPSVQGTLPEDLLPGLKPLLQTAVERSPNTIMAAINVEQQEASKIANFAALYPQANLSGSYAVNTESESGSPSNTSRGLFYGLGVSQSVFQWGAVKNAALIGSLSLKIAERQYAEGYRQLAIILREQYMALIEKKIRLRNDDFKVKIAEENLEAQQARFQSGSSSEAEVQSFQLTLQDAQLTRDRSADDFDYSKQQFMRLVGVEELDAAAIPMKLPHPEYSSPLADSVYAGFVGNGIESTFQSQVYQITIKQQELQYSIAKVRMLPKFSASASYGLSNNTAPSGNGVVQYKTQSLSYGISAGWDIFDGFSTRASKLSALASERSAERTMKSYVDATIDSIADMRRQLGFSARGLALAEIHLALIDSQVKRLGDDKALGYASQATIDTGILDLDATEFDTTYARADYLGRWSEFISLAGLDPATDNISPRYVR